MASIDLMTQQLFEPYTRQVGKHRYVINSFRQFEEYVERTSGRDDVYVSVYPLDKVLDRLTFDFDGRNALVESRRVYQWCLEQGYPVIPVISGSKGIHLHILFRPVRVPKPKEFLMDKAVFILSKSLGVKRFDDTSVDFHVVGNPEAMIRVPNTLRYPENNRYCSYLPVNWHLLSEPEVLHYATYPHTIFYQMNPKVSLLEIGDAPSELDTQPKPHISDFNPMDILGDYRYIPKLLVKPIADGRHRVSRFILCPYFVNIVGLSESEAYFMISHYLDMCSLVRPTHAKSTLSYDINYAKRRGFAPWTLKSLESRDVDLYNLIIKAISDE